MDRIIEVKVNGSYITKDNRNAGVQHEANSTSLRIEFDPSWDSYAKKITWWNAKGEDPVEITLGTNLLEDAGKDTRVYLCPIPGEPLAECGECTFVIDGYVDGKRQRSAADRLWVKEAPFKENAGQPSDPTPSQAEQLQTEIDGIKGTISQAIASRDAAAESAEQAKASETAAASSASAAEKSETAAAGSASSAAAAASAAAKSAGAAAQSEQNAKASENAAKSSETTASSAAATAVQAKTAAESAQTKADKAQTAAESAQTAAEAARGKAESAQTAAETARSAAESSETAAAASEKTARSWAVGGTGTREGEDTDNAKYWANQAAAIVGGDFATKTEAKGYVWEHNQSRAAHADLRQEIAWKEDKLKGSAGQFVGFDAEGNAVAVDAPNSLYLDSIAITTPPTKTAYKAGEIFNTAGMVVKAQYTNGTVIIAKDIVVTGWNVSPSGALEEGRTSVTVQYTENGVTKTASQAVTVTKTALTVPSQSGTLTYTGSPQSPAWSNYNSSLMTLGGTTSGTGAGSYSASFTIKNTALYCWPDGTTAAKTVTWSIGKTAGTLSLSKSSMTLQTGTISDTFTISTNSTGAISVSNSNMAVATASRSGSTVTVTSVGAQSGTAVITVSAAGDSNHTAPDSKTCTVNCTFLGIYGVVWDGTSTTVWSRTDEAANFVNPTPYRAGATSYGSPFDNLYPWSGMVRVTDAVAGELVAIPKFWYKWTKSGNSLKLQIADKETDGFHVSPAHADRGDGKGERDIVYIGRYHCNTNNYKSQSGVKPKADITRSEARTSIHNLGSNIWQSDIQMRMTIWMLYLVEFADWNSQKTIGKGGGNKKATENMGYTDSMPYHTGTTLASRDSYGIGTQYRYIEGLWENVFDYGDGCYYNSAGLNIINTPSNFSDNSGGTAVGVPASGWPSAFTVATVAGLEWVIYPTAKGGSETTYSADYWNFNASVPCLSFGGYFGQDGGFGLFNVRCSSASVTVVYIGCRLQKLP